MKNIFALILGSLFSTGLTISGMTDSNKIIGFLNITDNWNASLLFVMAAALIIAIPGFYFVQKMNKPVLEQCFSLPTSNVIDKKLIFGAIIFGTGWGLYGYCPGPAIASLTYLNFDSYLFVLAMSIGMYLAAKSSDYFST